MLKLKEEKNLTKDKPIREAKLPQEVYIGLSQHVGKICEPLVSLDDSVLTGERIAQGENGIFSPIHSSVSGKVRAIKEYLHPVLGRCKTIVIESDGKDCLDPSIKVRQDVDNLSNDEMKDIIFNCGIVGLGGAAFPTHIKLSPPKEVDSFILNGAECEPYLTGDYRLMLERTDDILKGLEIIARILKIKKAYIAIEDNKLEAVHRFSHRLKITNYKLPQTKVVTLKSQYPQGGEKQLTKKILNREIPSGRLPFDVGAVVNNVATVLSIYEAIYENKPLYERVITVTGSCLNEPANLKVKIGTPIKDLIEECGGFKEEPAKIIMGGPMMGMAQYSFEVPVIKGTTGVIFLSKEEAKSYQPCACIRCGECVDTCPMGLNPSTLSQLIENEELILAKEYGVLDCIECGLCSYLCPARRPLVELIRYAKSKLKR